MALKWHPDRCKPEDKDKAQAKFQEIGEAFETLNDPEKKRLYDQLGPENYGRMGEGGGGGGDDGVPRSGPGGASFHFSPGGGARAEDIFRQFFAHGDPFASDGDPFSGGGGFGGGFPFMGGFQHMGGMPGMHGMPTGASSSASMGGRSQQPRQKDPPINHALNVSLEDLYTGTTKKVRITKKLTDSSGRRVQVASEKDIPVKAGWKDGTKITYANEGDENLGSDPADIIFTVQTKPHSRFIRDGNDLVHKCSVSLAEALTGINTSVLSLDNRVIPIVLRQATPTTTKIIPGEGMPISKVNQVTKFFYNSYKHLLTRYSC